MKEIKGNIWNQECDWLCITTNSNIRSDGNAVMGRGVALEAAQRFPGIAKVLANHLRQNGNVVGLLMKACGKYIFSFPTKNNWWDNSDLDLIKKSTLELKKLYDLEDKKPIVILPRPGCANGKLSWESVKPILEKILTDDNFLIYNL
jgi:hypothetical protein